jgi:hypothetical protein
MKTNGLYIKRFLFTAILLCFVAVVVQQKFRFKYEFPLAGAVTLSEKPTFSLKGWFDDSFQNQYQKYVNEHFGFRNYFVRLNNQLAFTLFNKAKANGVIISKENYLYEKNYIKAYYGLDSISNDSISTRLAKFKFVQDTLKKLNIDLLLIYAPGKAAYLPEYIPENEKPSKAHQTNYDRYIAFSKKLGVNFIDYHKYFNDQKSKTQYPLYPKFGIHWSSYGRDVVLDSLVHYIEKLKGIDLNDITFSQPVLSDSLRESDYDIADGMNLLFKLKPTPLAYSTSTFENNPSKTKPKLLVVADSYWWSIYNLGVSESVFSNGTFWFYNQQVYPESFKAPTLTSQLNLKSELENRDLIIVMSTDANLPNVGWGFIEKAYRLYTQGETAEEINIGKSEKVKNMMAYIRTQKEWFEGVVKQAIEKKITVDSMLMLNAIYTIDQAKLK